MKPFALILLLAFGLGAQTSAQTSTPASASASSELRGFAWDAGGRPVPDAKITIHGASQGADRTVTTGKDGAFDAKDLAPGHYELTAEAAKLQLVTEEGTPLDLKPGEIQHADLTLGLSTVHYGFWKRLGRRLDGIH